MTNSQTNDMLIIDVVKDIDRLQSYECDWKSLSLRSEDIGLIGDFHFILSWWESFNNGSRLWIIVVKTETGKWLAAAPMLIRATSYHGISTRVIRFLENGYVPSCGILIDTDFVESSMSRILEFLFSFKEWDIVQLCKVPSSGVVKRHAENFIALKGLRCGLSPSIETPVINIEDLWDDFLKSRSLLFRKQLRAKRNRFNRESGTSIQAVTVTSNNAQTLIETMTQISKSSWKSNTRTDLASHPDAQFFLKRLLYYLSQQNNAIVWLAFKDTLPIAYELHLQRNNITYPLRADFDENFRHLSPGSVLEAAIIENLFRAKEIKTYYSCGMTYDYLMRWTDRTVKHDTLEVFAPSVLMSISYWIQYRMKPLLRNLERRIPNRISKKLDNICKFE